MKKNLLCSLSTLTIVTILLQLGGCVPAAVVGVMGGTTAVATGMAEERGMGGVITDAGLKSKITDQLNAISYDLANKILVAVYQRQVVLTGTVEDEKMQIDAVRAVWEIANIEAVYDEIHIGKITPMSQITKDSWISTQIKTQLLFSKKVTSINYEYVTHEAVVYLVGVAQNQVELDEVIHIVRTISGVKKVVSHIKIKNQGIHYHNDYHQPLHQPAKAAYPGATMSRHPNPYHMPINAPETLTSVEPLYGPNMDSAFND